MMGFERFLQISLFWIVLLGLIASAYSRQVAPVLEKIPKQFEQIGGPDGGFQGGGNNGNFQGGPGGQFPQQPGTGTGSGEAVEEEEEDSSPGPGALGVLTGLWGVFNGIGSLLNGGSPNKILESSVNFFPPHERDKAQMEVNRLLGKTTRKPEIIYVTVTLPTPAPTPTPVPAPVVVTQPPVIIPATPAPAAVMTQSAAVTAATVPAPAVAAVVQSANATTLVTSTADPEDSEEEDEYKIKE